MKRYGTKTGRKEKKENLKDGRGLKRQNVLHLPQTLPCAFTGSSIVCLPRLSLYHQRASQPTRRVPAKKKNRRWKTVSYHFSAQRTVKKTSAQANEKNYTKKILNRTGRCFIINPSATAPPPPNTPPAHHLSLRAAKSTALTALKTAHMF